MSDLALILFAICLLITAPAWLAWMYMLALLFLGLILRAGDRRAG